MKELVVIHIDWLIFCEYTFGDSLLSYNCNGDFIFNYVY